MYENEVLVDLDDKERLIELLAEASSMLDRYDYFSKTGCHTVTVMARAKGAVKDAYEWCGRLYSASVWK